MSVLEELTSVYDSLDIGASESDDTEAADSVEEPVSEVEISGEVEEKAKDSEPDEISDDDLDAVELSDEELEAIRKEVGAEETETDVDAPQHWSQEDKDTFNAAPAELKQWLMDRHKAMEGDYTRKQMERADFNRRYEPIDEMFKQYPNANPTEMIQNWAQIAQSLDQNPVGALQYLAQQYGVDLGAEMPEVDPHYAKLENEIQQLRRESESIRQQEQQAAQTQTLNQIQDFMEAKDDSGNLKFPYAEEAMSTMTQLAKVAVSEGRKPELSDLYEQAIYANPDIRQKVLQAQEAQKKGDEMKAAIAKAKRAKMQSKSLAGGSQITNSPAEDLSLRESLERHFG